MVGRLSTNGDFSGPVLTLLRSSQQPRSHIPQVTFGSLPMGWCPVGKPAASAGPFVSELGGSVAKLSFEHRGFSRARLAQGPCGLVPPSYMRHTVAISRVCDRLGGL